MAWEIHKQIFDLASSFEEILEGFRWEVPERMNLGELCDDQPKDELALVIGESGDSFRFGDIASFSRSFASFLTEVGISGGEMVGVMLGQSLESAVAHLGTLKEGCISVPLSPLLGFDAIAFRLRHSEAKVFVGDKASLRKLSDSGFRPALTIGVEGGSEYDFHGIINGSSRNFQAADTKAGDPAILIYTSGTTSTPKGALLPHSTVLGRLPGFLLAHHPFPTKKGIFWTPAEWSWVAGLLDSLFCPWSLGFPVLTSTPGKFYPKTAFELIERYRVTHACIPPTALRMMAKDDSHKDFSLSSLRSVHGGGEPLTHEAFSWAKEKLGIEVREIYGLTEASFLIGNSPLLKVRPGSIGKPYLGHKVDLLDEDGRSLPPGRLGQIAVRRDPVVFLGYWRDEKSTRMRMKGEWFMTGDLAVKDSDGYFWFKGRNDDIIKVSGRRISPLEVEASLLSHPQVEDAGVIGIPEPLRGSAVVAFVRLKDGFQPSSHLEEELKKYVKEKLSGYHYPRKIVFLEIIPRTTTGKVMRRALRENTSLIGA